MKLKSSSMKVIAAELDRYGVRYDIERARSDHIRFIWQLPGSPKRILYTTGTRTDYRGILNARAVARRYLREDGVIT